jgi:hypothetical protein
MMKMPGYAACCTVPVMAFFSFDIQNGQRQYDASLEQAELNMIINMLTKEEFNRWMIDRIKKEWEKMVEEGVVEEESESQS